MAQAKKVTRLSGIDAERVDGVTDPANGFPILMMKSIGTVPAVETQTAKESGVADTADQTVTPDPPVEETPEGQSVEKTSETPESQEQPGLDPAVASAIAKAVEPLEAANQELRDEIAVLKATPIPGGPALTAPADVRATAAKAESLAKAAYYDRQAELCENSRELKQYYTDKAREARGA